MPLHSITFLLAAVVRASTGEGTKVKRGTTGHNGATHCRGRRVCARTTQVLEHGCADQDGEGPAAFK